MCKTDGRGMKFILDNSHRRLKVGKRTAIPALNKVVKCPGVMNKRDTSGNKQLTTICFDSEFNARGTSTEDNFVKIL